MTADSFKAELAAFRRHIEPGPDGATKALILGILDRWTARDLRWTDLWDRMGEILPLRPPAGIFIASVVQSRRLSDDGMHAHADFPQLRARARNVIEKDWNSPDGDFALAAAKKGVLREAEQAFDGFDKALGREKSTAQKRKFVELWSDHFREHTGKPADEIVAVLTEISFGGKFDVTDVRNALKFRQRRTSKDTHNTK
jgi:hypothetical protein